MSTSTGVKYSRRKGSQKPEQTNLVQPAFDIYQHVTDRIVSMVEQGTKEWKMPWHRGAGLGMPSNAQTAVEYRGINVLQLWMEGQIRKYESSKWATFLQWQEMGANVRKGEKSCKIVVYKPIDKNSGETETDGDGDKGRKFFLKHYSVFNADQVDGFTDSDKAESPDQTTVLKEVDDFICSTKAKVQFGGNAASYSRALDRIRMPQRNKFVSTETSSATEAFYSTYLHELSHWSGHSTRLAREFGQRFGDDAYAFEELVAEFSASFLCAKLHVSPELREDHASYISAWLKIMKGDKRAAFAAASHAAKAADYLFGLQPKEAANDNAVISEKLKLANERS